MKNIFSKLFVPSLVALSLGFVGCSDDNDEPAVGPESQGAYFPSSSQTAYYVEPDETQVTVYIARTDASSAQTVSLSAQDESGLFTVPTSVSFDAGSKEASFSISFDANKFDPKDYPVVITVAPNDAYLYGMTEYSITIGLENTYRWLPIGSGQYKDNWIPDNPKFYDVEFQQHALNKNSFRIKSPYAEMLSDDGVAINPSYPPSEWIYVQVLSPGQEIDGIKITMEDLVYFQSFCSGLWMSNYNAVIDVRFPGDFSSSADESAWTYNKVKSYQDNGMPNVVQLAPFFYMTGVGGWNQSQNNDIITIIFPGGRLMDASAEVEILSVEATEESEVATIKANVKLGADVTSARVALVEGDDDESADFMVTHDRLEYITIQESGEVTFTMPTSSPSGTYMIIACTYVGKKAVEYNFETFDYQVPGVQPWTKIGTGTYTYSVFWKGDDEGLELYQSTDDPTLYKITNWGYGVDFYFTMTDGYKITVKDQFTGVAYDSYGKMFVDDVVDYADSEDYGLSLYVNGTYNFNVAYYFPSMLVGHGYETFVLDPVTSRSAVSTASYKSTKSVSTVSLNRFNSPLKYRIVEF